MPASTLDTLLRPRKKLRMRTCESLKFELASPSSLTFVCLVRTPNKALSEDIRVFVCSFGSTRLKRANFNDTEQQEVFSPGTISRHVGLVPADSDHLKVPSSLWLHIHLRIKAPVEYAQLKRSQWPLLFKTQDT